MILSKINLMYFDETIIPTAPTEDVEALKKQLAIAQAEAEIAKRETEKAVAKLSKGSKAPAIVEVEKTPEEFLEERVPVMLFKDGEKYIDDVILAINGEKIQIQRGIQVYIKRKFAMVLESHYRQQLVAADMQSKLAEEYAAERTSRGL